MVDCMIAAIALTADAAIASANASDFVRLAPFGVRLAAAR